MLEQFHLMRPWWLLALLPVAWLLLSHWRQTQRRQQWQDVIDPELQDFMLENPAETDRKTRRWPLALALTSAVLALAGPSWQQLPQPLFKNERVLVILLDLSYSMAAEDVAPSRAERARQKITDILQQRDDGQVAMVAYAGDAHTVTPVTDDARTLLNLLPALSPYIMPAPGSRPDLAIRQAQQLVRSSGYRQAELLLLTDGIQPKDVERISEALDQPDFRLSVIALGSPEGAPIPLPDGGFLKDNDGNIVITGLDTGPLQTLRQKTGIRWQPISLLDDDWQSLIDSSASARNSRSKDSTTASSRQSDQWLDQGYWLLLLAMPVALMAFRRGNLAVLCLLVVLPALQPAPALAGSDSQTQWQDWWQTADQQGAELLEENPAAAAERFENPAWKGSAAYRAGDYETAIKSFRQDNSARGRYNLGNALAQSGRFEEALEAYDKALELDPALDDARQNRDIVEQQLQQQEQQQSSSQESNSQDSSSQDSSSQDSSSQNSDSQNSNQQGKSSDSDSANGQNSQNQSTDNQQRQSNSRQQDDQAFEERLQREQQQSEADAQSGDDTSEAAERPSSQSEAQSPDQSQSTDTGRDPTEQELQEQRKEQGEQPDNRLLGDIPADSLENLSPAEQARLRQWLNRVPDQPGDLLRRKFLYQYSQRHPQQQQQPDDGEVLW